MSSPTKIWLPFSVAISGGLQGYIASILPETGALTAYPLPLTNVVPYKLTLAADGNVWFVASNGYLGNISPSGVIEL